MSDQKLPKGWDEARVKKVIDHYDGQSDEDAAAEDDAVLRDRTVTYIAVPRDLVDEVQEFLRQRTGTEG